MLEAGGFFGIVAGALVGALVTFLALRRRETPAKSERPGTSDRFKRAFDGAPVGIALVTTAGQWLQVNKRLPLLLGYGREDLVRTTIRDITHPEDRRAENDQLKRLLAGEIREFTLDKRVHRKDGRQVWVHQNVSLVRKSGADTDYLVYVLEESSDRRGGADTPAGGDNPLQIVLDKLQDIAVLRVSPEGTVLNANKGIEKILGYRADEIIGRKRDLYYRDQDVYEEKPGHDLRAAAEEAFSAEDWRVGKDGFVFWSRVTLAPERRGNEIIAYHEVIGQPSHNRGVDEYRKAYERLKETSETRIEELRGNVEALKKDVAKKEGTVASLKEALEQLRISSEELVVELKIMAEALRKEMQRRKSAEEAVRETKEELERRGLELAQLSTQIVEEPVELPKPEVETVIGADVPADAEWRALSTRPPAELLVGLGRDQKTGTLFIRSQTVEKKIYFDKGKIFSCASNDPRFFLAQQLIEKGLITDEQRLKAMEVREQTGIPLGRILVITSAITEDQMREAMVAKAEEEIVDLFNWTEGEVVFIDGQIPRSLQFIPVRLDPAAIVARGLQRRGDLERAAMIAAAIVPEPERPEQEPEPPKKPASQRDLFVPEQPSTPARVDVDAEAVSTTEEEETELDATLRQKPEDFEPAVVSPEAAVAEAALPDISESDIAHEAARPDSSLDARNDSIDEVEAEIHETAPAPSPQPPAPSLVGSRSKGSKKYHLLDCSVAKRIFESTRVEFPSAFEAEAAGYEPCGRCIGKAS